MVRDRGMAGDGSHWQSFKRFMFWWGGPTLSLIAASAGAGVLAWATNLVTIAAISLEPSPVHTWLAIALIIASLLSANLLRMLQIWSRLRPVIETQPAKRDAAQHTIASRGFRELFAYMFVGLSGLTAFAFLSAEPGRLPWPDLRLHEAGDTTFNVAHVCALLACVALTLLPLSLGFFLHSSAERRTFDRKILRDDSIQPSSFWLAFFLLAGIVALATWAARVSQNQNEGLAADLAYWITFGVVATFIAFIFLPYIQRSIDQIAENERDPAEVKAATPLLIGAPAIAASWLDSLLVRLVAPLTGATQHGLLIPHSFVILSLLPLTALGFVLPQPFGLVPIFLGMLMIFALGRRWAWIEEDRELASRLLQTDAKEIQIGFENDLKDEALLGYAFLFILVPLSLHQINGIAEAFTATDGEEITNPFFSWLSFFGGELAKAVPFVDWWEIYNVRIDAPVQGVCAGGPEECTPGTAPHDIVPMAKHLTFAARAMVDLVIMAALFQAIGIWQRSRAQDKLYDSGQINAFDPFTEERFFKRGMKKSGDRYTARRKFEERVEKHLEKRKGLNLDPVPYNQMRLGELERHPDSEVREGANWMISHFGVLAGEPNERLAQLAAQWRTSWYSGNKESGPISHLDKQAQQIWRRKEKLRLEPLLSALIDEDREVIPFEMTKTDVCNIMQIMSLSGNAVEFQFARLNAIELLADVPDASALWALAAHVCPDHPSFARWRAQIVEEFGKAIQDDKGGLLNTIRFGREELRARCYTAIADNPNESPELRREILSLLVIIDGTAWRTRKGETRGAREALRTAIRFIAASIQADVALVSDDDSADGVDEDESEHA